MTIKLWDTEDLKVHRVSITVLEFLEMSDDCVEFIESYSLITPRGERYEGLQVFIGWLEYIDAPLLPMAFEGWLLLLNQMKLSLTSPLINGYKWRYIIEDEY